MKTQATYLYASRSQFLDPPSEERDAEYLYMFLALPIARYPGLESVRTGFCQPIHGCSGQSQGGRGTSQTARARACAYAYSLNHIGQYLEENIEMVD
jgi:hypothetical protein